MLPTLQLISHSTIRSNPDMRVATMAELSIYGRGRDMKSSGWLYEKE